MTPAQFLREVQTGSPGPVYLFLGPERYDRERCRAALIERFLTPDEREQGLTRHDLSDVTLAQVLDDACSLSLFAPRRVIWVGSAEAALPRGRAAAAEASEEEGESRVNVADLLGRYVKEPSPGTVLVFESGRYEFEGEDKARAERVRKFYAAVPAVVEFTRYTPEAAGKLAADLARTSGLRMAAAEVEMLVEACSGDAARIAGEIEKLSLYAGGRAVTAEDLESLILNARRNTVFELVGALGRRDCMKALDVLDALLREGEYIPLALSFLATQLRLALAASDAGLRGSSQIQNHFQKIGVQMWRSRAEQVAQSMTAFPKAKLERALTEIYATDKMLRDTNADERLVLEGFVLRLTE